MMGLAPISPKGGAEAAAIPNKIPVLGFYQTKSTDTGGRLVVYGDSNCIDSAHIQKDCW